MASSRATIEARSGSTMTEHDPGNLAIAVPALLTGFVINPAWYAWLGVVLWRGLGGQS